VKRQHREEILRQFKLERYHAEQREVARRDLEAAVRAAREDGVTPAEIAEVLGVTQSHISRIAPLRKNKRRKAA